MTDITYTLKPTVRRATETVLAQGEAGNVKLLTTTKSVTARTANDTMKAFTAPSNARIAGASKVYWDDLASSGSPTLDIGIAPVDDAVGNITADADALNAGLVITAAGSAALIADHANYGKMLWELLGLASDPGGALDVYYSFVDANTNITGDVTTEVMYTLD